MLLDAERVEVISPSVRTLSKPELELLKILNGHGICLMDRQTLMQPIPMVLFNVEPEKTCLYHSLFTDVDVLPWDATPPLRNGEGLGDSCSMKSKSHSYGSSNRLKK